MYEKIIKKRTIRLFKQEPVDYKILEKCIDAARQSSSARNSQPLEYIIIDNKETLKNILPLLNFGGFISEDKKAKKGYEPTAVIIIIVKSGSEDYYKYDVGIAAQNIALVAFENNIGCCMMGAVQKEEIKKALNVPDDYFVDLAIALGYPTEQPVAEETSKEPEYYRDEKGILHIPKRKLKEVVHRNKF
ncbi:nitroreductase family protein [Candidatus Woesearchaeota archaeon]|nr:nitroreductase family protein [Candidatus Woesearchaeota archaeon]